MIEAPHYSAAGAKKSAEFALPGGYFDGDVNEAVLHTAVRAYLNNQRQGTAATKTRSFVSGGNQKPWKQKGTGRARAGSSRSPLWRGGGIVFGPSPRDYRTDIPRKVRLLARRSALNTRAATGGMVVVEALAFSSPKTGQLVELLAKLGVAEKKVLILTHGVHEALYLSSRNLPRVHVMNYAEAAAYDVLWADVVVVEEGALSDEPTPAVRTFTPTPRPAPDHAAPVVRKARPAPKPKAESKPKAETKAKPKAEAKPARKSAAKPKAEAKPAAKKTDAKKPAAKKSAPKKKGGK
jgi:large subunit ribosomal protein L4